MRTNIDIDDQVLEAAMQSGAYKTKKEVVEAGLRLIARQAAYREILKWEGKLQWDGDDPDDGHDGHDGHDRGDVADGSGKRTARAATTVPQTGQDLNPAMAPQVQEPARKRRHAGR